MSIKKQQISSFHENANISEAHSPIAVETISAANFVGILGKN
jgi:hypothetical protein